MCTLGTIHGEYNRHHRRRYCRIVFKPSGKKIHIHKHCWCVQIRVEFLSRFKFRIAGKHGDDVSCAKWSTTTFQKGMMFEIQPFFFLHPTYSGKLVRFKLCGRALLFETLICSHVLSLLKQKTTKTILTSVDNVFYFLLFFFFCSSVVQF